jgi:hypothetical protein
MWLQALPCLVLSTKEVTLVHKPFMVLGLDLNPWRVGVVPLMQLL